MGGVNPYTITTWKVGICPEGNGAQGKKRDRGPWSYREGWRMTRGGRERKEGERGVGRETPP